MCVFEYVHVSVHVSVCMCVCVCENHDNENFVSNMFCVFKRLKLHIELVN